MSVNTLEEARIHRSQGWLLSAPPGTRPSLSPTLPCCPHTQLHLQPKGQTVGCKVKDAGPSFPPFPLTRTLTQGVWLVTQT